MGCLIEINDTLKLPDLWFPKVLEIGEKYLFTIAGRRLYNLAPTRVFLVRETGGKWDYMGHCHIVSLTIDAERDETSGVLVVVKVYSNQDKLVINSQEAPVGKGFIAVD